MRVLAIVIIKTLDGTEVEIAFNPSGNDATDCLVTRHPPGTLVTTALLKLLPLLQHREAKEAEDLLNQRVKGTA